MTQKENDTRSLQNDAVAEVKFCPTKRDGLLVAGGARAQSLAPSAPTGMPGVSATEVSGILAAVSVPVLLPRPRTCQQATRRSRWRCSSIGETARAGAARTAGTSVRQLNLLHVTACYKSAKKTGRALSIKKPIKNVFFVLFFLLKKKNLF
jgi:hypothetical protein